MTPVPADVVRRLVDSQFPAWRSHPIRPVDLDGWDNTTYRLGDDLVVRLPNGDGYVPQVDKEHRWLPVLAPALPLEVPVPVALGAPTEEFPRPWSVRRWIDGAVAATAPVDPATIAGPLAEFLVALRGIDARGGPAAGPHSAFRGSPLVTYDDDARRAIEGLSTRIDADAATTTWQRARASRWPGPPVWVHGDVAPSNLLVRDGELAAVIDFGCSAVGDPACDLAIAWTSFDGDDRSRFARAIDLDDDTWDRARGWALWKAAITLAGEAPGSPSAADAAARWGWRADPLTVIASVLAGTGAPDGAEG